MPLQKKNKLLLLLFHRNLDSEMFYPYLSSFLSIQKFILLCMIWKMSDLGGLRRKKHWGEQFWEEDRNVHMRCGFLFGYKELNIHRHSVFEDLPARSAAVTAAFLFFWSLYSTAHRAAGCMAGRYCDQHVRGHCWVITLMTWSWNFQCSFTHRRYLNKDCKEGKNI